MSHQTKVETQINDAQALKVACAELGLQLVENERAREYGGRVSDTVHPYVIKCKGPYDIAVTKKADGKFELSTDWWGGHVAKEVGIPHEQLVEKYGVDKANKIGANNMNKLTKHYGLAVAEKEAKKKGLFVQKTFSPSGAPRLVITGRFA